MLSSIEICNFKPHKYLKVELTDGLNTIVGHSNLGKSAFIQACRWLNENKPTGLGFKNWSASDDELVSVKYNFDNGDSIIREKNESTDRYRLIVGGKEKVFDRPNKGVPDEISNYLNLSYYNIKTQFAPFFLLQDSPGDVGRKFNEIVDLTIIDEVVKKSKNKVSEAKDKFEKAEEEVKRLEKEISDLDYVDSLHTDVFVLEGMYDKYNERKGELDYCTKALDDIAYYRNITKHDEYILTHEEDIDKLISYANLYYDQKDKFGTVYDLVNEIYELQEEIKDSERTLQYESEVDELVRLEESKWARKAQLNEVDDLIDEIGEQEEQVEEYEKLLKNGKDIEELIRLNEEFLERDKTLTEVMDYRDDIIRTEVELGGCELKLRDLELGYKKWIDSLEYCPTCGSELNEEKIKRMVI